jgi:hypothetical protein
VLHAVKCANPASVDFTLLKSICETRWCSTHTHVESFCKNKTTLIYQCDVPRNPLVLSAVYDLTDNDWLDLQVIQKITGVIKGFQLELEGEKYITCSMVIQLLEAVRVRLDSTLMQCEENVATTGL